MPRSHKPTWRAPYLDFPAPRSAIDCGVPQWSRASDVQDERLLAEADPRLVPCAVRPRTRRRLCPRRTTCRASPTAGTGVVTLCRAGGKRAGLCVRFAAGCRRRRWRGSAWHFFAVRTGVWTYPGCSWLENVYGPLVCVGSECSGYIKIEFLVGAAVKMSIGFSAVPPT